MELTLNTLIDESEKVANNNDLYSLLHEIRTLLIEFKTHTGRTIEIGNNATFPLNEKKYTLVDAKFYKILDGTCSTKWSIAIIITVKDENDSEISFSYNYVYKIERDLLNAPNENFKPILKYSLSVRNKAFDNLYDMNDNLKKYEEPYSNDFLEFIDFNRFSTFRFFIYD